MDELATSQHNLRGLQLTPAAPVAWLLGFSDLVLKHQLRTSNQATDCVPMCRRWNPAGRTMLTDFRFVSNFSVLSDKYKYIQIPSASVTERNEAEPGRPKGSSASMTCHTRIHSVVCNLPPGANLGPRQTLQAMRIASHFAHCKILLAERIVFLASANSASCSPILFLQNSCGRTALRLQLLRWQSPKQEALTVAGVWVGGTPSWDFISMQFQFHHHQIASSRVEKQQLHTRGAEAGRCNEQLNVLPLRSSPLQTASESLPPTIILQTRFAEMRPSFAQLHQIHQQRPDPKTS